MRRNFKLLLAIGIPVLALVIVAIVLISLSFKTCPEGKICFIAGSNTSAKDGKYYTGGTHLIGLADDYAETMVPDSSGPMIAAVWINTTVKDSRPGRKPQEQSVIVMYKWYIGKDKVGDYIERYGTDGNEYQLNENFVADFTELVINVTQTVECQDIENSNSCWGQPFLELYLNKSIEHIEKENLPYQLYGDEPVRSVMFVQGCSSF